MRVDLDQFVGEVFASLARKDQRSKGSLYLQGLMLDGRRKSMQPMGDRLGIDYQQLQQFVSSSPWPVEPVRKALVRKAIAAIGPHAWVVDDTGFVKDGPASPGVARQYSGTLGKFGNVQVGVSVHAVTDRASCPLGLRLFLRESWDDVCSDTNEHAAQVAARRARAKSLTPSAAGPSGNSPRRRSTNSPPGGTAHHCWSPMPATARSAISAPRSPTAASPTSCR